MTLNSMLKRMLILAVTLGAIAAHAQQDNRVRITGPQASLLISALRRAGATQLVNQFGEPGFGTLGLNCFGNVYGGVLQPPTPDECYGVGMRGERVRSRIADDMAAIGTVLLASGMQPSYTESSLGGPHHLFRVGASRIQCYEPTENQPARCSIWPLL